MECPECGSKILEDIIHSIRPIIKDIPDIQFIDIQFKCTIEICGFSWNCVGAKQINTS